MSGQAPAASNVRVGVAIPAAGTGQRMGGVRKAFLEILGQPLLLRSLEPFLAEPRVQAVVVAVGADVLDDPPEWLEELAPRVHLVAGGATRAASVRHAMAALPRDVDVIAIHDAARPLLRAEVLSACIEKAAAGVGAVAGAPAVDTMKEVDAEVRITGSPDRSRLWHAHTPQVFPAPLLRRAYAGDAEATDDAALVAAVGGVVELVDDGGWNIKVTRPDDVRVVEALLIDARTVDP